MPKIVGSTDSKDAALASKSSTDLAISWNAVPSRGNSTKLNVLPKIRR
jgi:hypothetical protein